MKCPNDQATLLITERRGIEIDYCPECRGVWLDRGELDKLIDQAPVAPSETPRERAPEQPRYEAPRSGHEDNRLHDSHSYEQRHHKKHRKESFLGDLFDF